MTKRVYITTPIYYANAVPHIGNAYSSFIADTLARIKRLCGYTVKFCTGTDENGQKMTQKAAEQGKDVMSFLDEVAALHQQTRDGLAISYTDFIRTSSKEHHDFVQYALQKTYDAGDIYQDVYEGLYCIGCEGFKKESDLVEYDGKKVCPYHLTPPEIIQENNRFFRLAGYEKRLLELYKRFASFCYPSQRFNEVISFVEQGLDNFSISREGSSFGIKMPFDENSVTYIWFDALYNYLTACAQRNTLSGGENDLVFWNDADVIHVVGKDIARFHAVYRPAMLMSAHFKLPSTVLITGFFTIDGQKMSKTLGNTIDPIAAVKEHGRDALVYYFFNDIKIGSDGDFSRERFHATKESSLKKGRGNLVSRVVTLAKKNHITQITISKASLEAIEQLAEKEGLADNRLRQSCTGGSAQQRLDAYLKTFDLRQLTRDRFSLVQLGNKRIDTTQPRVSAKETPEKAKEDIAVALWLIKNIGVFGAPLLTEGRETLRRLVNINNLYRTTLSTVRTFDHLDDLIALRSFSVTFGEGHLYE